MSGTDRGTTVLLVDDEPAVADAYALRLEERYDVLTAYGGREAMAEMDADVDVVLLDRRMPDMSGDEVLEAIREAGYDCRVVMVTAIAPDYDVIDLPFDDYLCKPVDHEDLFDAIEQQLRAREYQETVSEFLAITAKQSILEQRKSPAELNDNEEYDRLRERAERLRAELDEKLESFEDLAMAFADIDRA